MPQGEQTIEGQAGKSYNTFWGLIKLGANREVTFTITFTTTLKQQDACSAPGTVPVNSWARASATGFTIPGDVETVGSALAAHNLGQITAIGTTECPFGVVTMTNTLTSPINPSDGNPGIPLSQDPEDLRDPMEFIATWHNTSGQSVTLPIDYTYVLPSEGDETQANWTCTSSSGGLGYANKAASGSTAAQPGLANGYLGVGFDVFSNFASTSTNAAPQCLPGATSVPIKNSVTLRGPGNGPTGYCAVGPSQRNRHHLVDADVGCGNQ